MVLWTLWDERELAVWLPLATAAGLLLVLHRRLLDGLATLSRRRERFDL